MSQSATATEASGDPTPAALAAGQPRSYALNPADRLLLVGQRALRAAGQPGWPIQSHFWLRGRVDVPLLRRSLQQLNQLHPIATSRIVGRCQDAVWRTRPGAPCVLEEWTLAAATREAVLRQAEEILVQPVDLETCDPIRFHLMHLPDGRDVFMFQYDHTLMDANAAVPLLKELDRLAAVELSADQPPQDRQDDYQAFLDRFTRWERLRAAWNSWVDAFRCWRLRAVTLEPPHEPIAAAPTVRVCILSAEQTAAISQHATEVTGVPSLAMAILSSAFRGIRRLTQQPLDRRSTFMAKVGVRLRRVATVRDLFCNLIGLLTIRVAPDELDDRDQALQAATRSLQEQLAKRIDLGGLALCRGIRFDSRGMQAYARKAARSPSLESLRFGFFGELHAAGDKFLGVEVELAHIAALAMPPWGILLWTNVSAGRVVLTLVYHKPAISDELAQQFLDFVQADLISTDEPSAVP